MKLSSVFSYADIVDMRNEGLNDDEIIQRAKEKLAYQNSPEYRAAKRLDDTQKNELKTAFDNGANRTEIDAIRARHNIQKARILGGASSDGLENAANAAQNLEIQAINQKRDKDLNALQRYYYGGVQNVNGIIAGLAKMPIQAAKKLDKRISQYEINKATGKETETHAKNLASKIGGFLADSWRSEGFKNIYDNADRIAKEAKEKRQNWKLGNPDSWDVAGTAGEFVNDPFNLVGGKLIAQGMKQGYKKLGANALEGAALGAVLSAPHASYNSNDLADFATGVGIGAGAGALLQPALVYGGEKIANWRAKKASDTGATADAPTSQAEHASQTAQAAQTAQTSRTAYDNLATDGNYLQDGNYLDISNTAPKTAVPVTSEQEKAMRASDELGLVRGAGFVTDPKSAKVEQNIGANFELAPNVRDLANISTDEISADLSYLADKHPEMFEKASDVFKLIKEIKDEPQFFYRNNRLDGALIAKRLQEQGKIGKIVVDKESAEVIHATKSRESDLARLERVANKNDERMRALSAVSSRKVEQGDGLPNENISQRPLKTADDENIIDLVPDENGVYQVAFNGSSKELAKMATEIAKGEIKSLGAKKLAYMADNIAAAAAKHSEQIISTNIAKINDGSIEFYANNINILNEVAKKYPMLSKPEKIELANKQILANASAQLLEYSKFLNGGSLPNDARLLGKNAGRMILKSLDAGASAQEVINMLLKAGISGRNSTAAKALLQTGDINAYNAVMRQGEAELIAELSNNVRAQAKNEIIGQILNSAKPQAIKNDEMLKKGLGNQDLDDITTKFISEKTGKEFEVAENGFGRELMKYEGKEASDDMKRSFSAWEAQGQKADITLNDGRKVVYLSPDEAVELSYGNAYLYGHKSYEELMATKMAESLEQKFERLKRHPAYENLLKMRENKLAKELKGEKVGGSRPTVYYEPQSDRYLRTAGGGGIDNPEREIRISKSDVAKLRAGKVDEALAIKLENSLEALTGDPAASGVLDHLLTRDFHLGTAEYKKGLVETKTPENSRISGDEVAKTAENSRISSENVAKSGYLPPLKQEQNKNFETYDKLISMFEDNLEKRANAYVDFGGSIKQASNGQLDSRFNKKDKVDFLGKYLADYPTPKTISQAKAKSLAFANKENKSLTKQQISDLFGYYKNNEQSKDLLDKNIEYALSKELLEPVINESEKAFNDIAKKYRLPAKFRGRVMDDIRYRHKLVTRATDQTKDQFQIGIFKDFAKRLEHLEQNTSFKNSEEALRQNSIKDTEFLIKATPFLKETKSGGDYVSELNGLKQKAMMDKMSELLAKNASESELEKLVDTEYISELGKEAFAKKYGFDYKMMRGFSTAEVPSTIVGGGVGHMAGSAVGAVAGEYESEGGVAGAIIGALAGLASPKAAAKIAAKMMSKKASKIELLPNMPFKEAQNKVQSDLMKYIGVDIKNADSGIVAQINNNGAKKIVSNEAIKKSGNNGFSAGEHLSVARKTPELFKDATFVGRYDDIKNGESSVKILRFAKNIEVKDKNAVAIITAKESVDKDLRRVYSVELEQLRKAELKFGNYDKTQTPANKSLISQDNGVVSSVAPIKDEANSTTSSVKSQELAMRESFSPELKASYEMRDKLLKSANEARAKLSQKGKDELDKLKESKDSKLSRDAQIMKTLENAKSNPARYEKLKKLYLDENGKVKDSIGLC